MRKALIVIALALTLVFASLLEVFAQTTTSRSTSTSGSTSTSMASTTSSSMRATSTTMRAPTRKRSVSTMSTTRAVTRKRATLPRTGAPLDPTIPLGIGSAALALSYLRKIKK